MIQNAAIWVDVYLNYFYGGGNYCVGDKLVSIGIILTYYYFFLITAYLRPEPFLPYGHRLLLAKEGIQLLPKPFPKLQDEAWPVKDDKHIITSMLRFDSLARTDMTIVESCLRNIANAMLAQRFVSTS